MRLYSCDYSPSENEKPGYNTPARKPVEIHTDSRSSLQEDLKPPVGVGSFPMPFPSPAVLGLPQSSDP